MAFAATLINCSSYPNGVYSSPMAAILQSAHFDLLNARAQLEDLHTFGVRPPGAEVLR